MEQAQKRKPALEASWLEVMADEFEKSYMAELRAFLVEEKRRGAVVYPPGNLIFNAMNTTPFNQVKVVILGQDPYHGPNQAHGLSFSVMRNITPPPSLLNIYKELHTCLGIQPARHGDLTSWAAQGVLLLNTTLTVRARTPKSHAGKGWEQFTDRVIDELNQRREGLVFMLWGAHAGSKGSRIDGSRHLILKAPHPSPFSAARGFFGCSHFLTANRHLESRGETAVDWRLPD